jgi:hypothetical protein
LEQSTVPFLRVQRYDIFLNHQNFSELFFKNPQKNLVYGDNKRKTRTFAA